MKPNFKHLFLFFTKFHNHIWSIFTGVVALALKMRATMEQMQHVKRLSGQFNLRIDELERMSNEINDDSGDEKDRWRRRRERRERVEGI